MRHASASVLLLSLVITFLGTACTKTDDATTITPTTTNPNITGYGIFSVASDGNLIINGEIGTNTPFHFDNIRKDNPNATKLTMMDCPGSSDDDANLVAARKIRTAGLNIHLIATSQIASGAVDMFIAGVKRTMETGAIIGVHSWSDGQNEATDFPKGHAQHQSYINYYKEMGFSQQQAEDFYYFTINAAPAAGIHNMTAAEIAQYGLLN